MKKLISLKCLQQSPNQWNPSQNTNDNLLRIRKMNPKIHVESQKIQNSQTGLNQSSWRQKKSDLKAYYKALVI